MASQNKKRKAKNSYMMNGGEKLDGKIKRIMYFTKRQRNKLKRNGENNMIWSANVGLTVNIDYDDIEADTEEEAIQIAKDRALEDIDYNNCNVDTDNPIVYYCHAVDKENENNEEIY